MPTLTIDGKEVSVEPGMTVLQACEAAGVEIPRFCYHERLSIAGNCRMCLVEMEKAPKPIASCAMPAGDGMVIHTNTPKVKKAREGVMEFLLINHPLDCPICDQGGECDLQDQTMAYGRGSSRYDENKRAVEEKHMGPLIKTFMTRCIHCTRCIRFAEEVAGVPELGATGRGEDMEITTYLQKTLASEMSANVIDLCPVGALTSRPYAFEARPWELSKTESIDVMDAVGSNIRVDARGPEVMRVLPRLNEDVNEEWISDKTRYACDGLMQRRLDRPYIKVKGKWQDADWPEAFQHIAKKIKGMDGSKMAALAGDLMEAEAVKALKDLMAGLGSPNLDCRVDGAAIDPSSRAGYLFNTSIAGIEEADACLIIGANPRHEAPIINTRLRKRFVQGGFKVGIVGQPVDLTYGAEYLGAGPATLTEIAEGKSAFSKILKGAEKPMLIIGQGALRRADGPAILALAARIANDFGMVKEGWNGFNMLHTAAGRVGALDLGFVPSKGGRDFAGILEGAASGDIEFVFNMGADEGDLSALEKPFVVYMGTHGDRGVEYADVILPGAAYTELSGTWVNTEGRVQRGLRAAHPPGDARENWTILRALSEVVGSKLPYDTLGELRRAMEADAPHLSAIDEIAQAKWGAFGKAGKVTDDGFTSPIGDFYKTNPVARASLTMEECSVAMRADVEGATGTNG
jgi:NADH-quinone oxidoreductase subunit G